MRKKQQSIAGIDGCKAGWFAILLEQDTDAVAFTVAASMAELLSQQPICRLWVDMAIGFSDRSEGRQCELLARKMLRVNGISRAASIFNPPSRQALYCDTYLQANRVNKLAIDKGLSKQSWFIMPKMREIDHLLQTQKALRDIIFECHPEVAFTALNGFTPMQHNKKTEAGYLERLALLERYYPCASEVIDKALSMYPRKILARDDIVDAFIIAISAKHSAHPPSSLPTDDEYDDYGIAMQMVYWDGAIR